MARGGQAGRARERQVADKLRQQDWVVVKGTTYGTCDLVALRQGDVSMLIEVKSTAGGPYEHFGPADRDRLVAEAAMAGARAVLAWWPPRGKMRLIGSEEWPKNKSCNKCGGRMVAVRSGAVVDIVRCTKCPREVPVNAMKRAA